MLPLYEIEKRVLELESRVSALEGNPAPSVEPDLTHKEQEESDVTSV